MERRALDALLPPRTSEGRRRRRRGGGGGRRRQLDVWRVFPASAYAHQCDTGLATDRLFTDILRVFFLSTSCHNCRLKLYELV